jgi:hypothetical protein
LNLADLINRMVGAGLSAGEAGEIAAEIYAAGVASVTRGASNAERQQRYRDRKRNERNAERNETVTHRNEPIVTETVTNRNETVTNRNAEDALSLSLDKKKEKKERGSQIPDGFKPDDVRWEAACRVFGRDGAQQELEKFVAHHKSKGTVFKNWNFGWDKWMLNAKQWAPKPVVSSIIQPESINWRQALESYKQFKRWPRGIGSDPDSPACRAPPELMQEFGFATIPLLRAMS